MSELDRASASAPRVTHFRTEPRNLLAMVSAEMTTPTSLLRPAPMLLSLCIADGCRQPTQQVV